MNATTYSSLDSATRFVLAGQILHNYLEMRGDLETERILIARGVGTIGAVARPIVVTVTGSGAVWMSNTSIARPKVIFLQDLARPELQLLRPLAISVEFSGSRAVAFSYDLDELATGSDESEALEEMRASIAEAYFLLKEERANLGPLQRRHWEFLTQVISER